MRTENEIYEDIRKRFEERINNRIADGAVLDLFLAAVSEEMALVYEEIEKNKNPHIWSGLEGDTLDDMGTMLNLPRMENETDTSYKYRLMNWVLSNEAGNETSVKDALLNPEYAVNMEFVPFTKGCGTATCYVLPKSYDTETIRNALKEAEQRIKGKVSPCLHVEYIVPQIIPVTLHVYISSEKGDIQSIKRRIEDSVRIYINSIAPKDRLQIGCINRMGINEAGVDYFSVVSWSLNGIEQSGREAIQGLDTKMIFDEIDWIEE